MLIKCQDAAFGYDGRIVVYDLNFQIDEGDFLCIAGENGCGKSTLLKGILSFFEPIEGSISFGDAFDKKSIGYVSQEAVKKKDFPAGVFEIVLSGNSGRMGLRPFYTKAEKNMVHSYLEQLGISDLKNACFRELSGGQQRRVLLARSLCAASKLLVLDEPFAGLDPLISADLFAILKDINREKGMTIIMVSHNIEDAASANKVLHLDRRQVFFGTMEEYRNSEIGKYFFMRRKNND